MRQRGLLTNLEHDAFVHVPRVLIPGQLARKAEVCQFLRLLLRLRLFLWAGRRKYSGGGGILSRRVSTQLTKHCVAHASARQRGYDECFHSSPNPAPKHLTSSSYGTPSYHIAKIQHVLRAHNVLMPYRAHQSSNKATKALEIFIVWRIHPRTCLRHSYWLVRVL